MARRLMASRFEQCAMKLILSRKGFDSAAGGCPSPIFPDGRMLSLPIPDKQSGVRYDELRWAGGACVGALVERLTRGKVRGRYYAHVDPDLDPAALPRESGWRPIFGQLGASSSHLKNSGVGPGDLFLYFGLFRDVEGEEQDIRFRPRSTPRHVIFGWLQAGSVLPADQAREELPWARYHPHLQREPGLKNNMLYVAADSLSLPGVPVGSRPGAGLFGRDSKSLRLTAPDSRRAGQWRLPSWFHPDGKPSALTYHKDPSRWSREGDSVILDAAARGQEFVLDCEDYPEAYNWLAQVLAASPPA